MKGKRKPKSIAPTKEERTEKAAFVAALKRHRQVQTDDGPLKPGVTHVLKKTSARAKPQLTRKRFSAI